MQSPPQARAILGQFLVGNEEVGYRIGVSSIWPSPWVQTITGQATTGQATTGAKAASQYGTPTFLTAPPQFVSPAGIPSAQAFGTILTRQSKGVGGINSAQAFGTVTPKATFTLTPSGIPSAQSFGTPTIKATVRVPVSGIPSAQAYGIPIFKIFQSFAIGGIPSAQAFGAITLKSVIRISVSGIPSAQAFGTIRTAVTARGIGINSAQAFGLVTFKTGPVTIPVQGIPSAQQFGTQYLVVSHRWIWDLDCIGTPDASICGEPICGDGHVTGGYSFNPIYDTCDDLDLADIVCIEPQETVCGYPSPTVTTPPLITGDGHVCGGISQMWELDCLGGFEEFGRGAVLNEFLVGDGTLVGSTAKAGTDPYLEPLPEPIELDLEELVCV